MRRALHHGLLGVALTVFAVAVTLGPILVVPAVVPGFGGQAGGIAVPLTVVGALGSLVALAASVGVGYRVQRRHGVRDGYRGFTAVLGCGGGVVLVLAVLALGVAGTLTTVSLALVVTMVLSVFVAAPVVVVVAALAGVTVATLAALAGLGVATVETGGGDGTTTAGARGGDSAGDDPSAVDRDGRSELSAVDEAPR
jgi:hypothetical protein